MMGQLPPVLYSVDLSDCAAIPQLTEDEIAEMFELVLRSAGATIVHTHSHARAGAGLTCTLILSESHAALRTWPDTTTVNVDIFSCSTGLNSLEAIENLRWILGAREVCIQEVLRADGHTFSEHHSNEHHSKLVSRRS
jgi:S-adenosylmethionine/arginine decarboxylase-like enzyme